MPKCTELTSLKEKKVLTLKELQEDLTIRLRACFPTDVAELLDRIAQDPSLKKPHNFFNKNILY